MSSRSGPVLGALAYFLWGLFPLYFHLLERSGPFEIVAHRAIWSLVFCLVLVLVFRRLPRLAALLRNGRTFGRLAVAGLLVAVNWTVYVWAVNNGHAIEASLGYFINPLVSALLGVVVLGERLRPAQWSAFGIGSIAVAVMAIAYGHFPAIAIALALSFGTYGLMKKQVGGRVGALEGLTVETLALLPIALGYVLWLGMRGESTVDITTPYGLLVTTAGPVTAVPLLLFAAAAARVSLTTIGMLQYIAPIMVFLFGWLMFGEPMPAERWAGFGLVWVAVLVFAADAARAASRARPPRLQPR